MGGVEERDHETLYVAAGKVTANPYVICVSAKTKTACMFYTQPRFVLEEKNQRRTKEHETGPRGTRRDQPAGPSPAIPARTALQHTCHSKKL